MQRELDEAKGLCRSVEQRRKEWEERAAAATAARDDAEARVQAIADTLCMQKVNTIMIPSPLFLRNFWFNPWGFLGLGFQGEVETLVQSLFES